MALDKADLVLHEGVVAGCLGSDSVAAGDGRVFAPGGFAPPKYVVWPPTHLIRLKRGLGGGMDEGIGLRLPRLTAAELESRARGCSRERAAAGVTAFTDATVRNGPDDVATLVRLPASGAIGQRIGVMIGQGQVDAINI